MPNYELSPTAEKDIQQVTRYTLNKWGSESLEKYITGLKATFDAIGNGDALKREFSKRFPLLLFKEFRRLKQGVDSLVYSAAALPCLRASRRRLSSVRIQALNSLASRCSDSLSDCVNRRGRSEVSRFALCEFVNAISKCFLPILVHAAAMLLINGR